MRILFMGSPEIAIPPLKRLLEGQDEIVTAVSQPDKPAGRGQELQACAVAQFARERNLPLLQPEKLNEETVRQIRSLQSDLIVVVGYGKILPNELLNIPLQKCVNVHFSLLPKYRGAAPVQWALINGETETGVTTLFMTDKLDAGPILLQKRLPIEPEDTVESLSRRLANAGADLLAETVDLLKRNELNSIPQNDREATTAPSLKKKDGRIDFGNKARVICNQIRGMTPWPGTFTLLEGRFLKVLQAEALPRHKPEAAGTILAVGPLGLEVACGQESLLLKEVQLEGKRRMPATEFLKGHPLKPGAVLG